MGLFPIFLLTSGAVTKLLWDQIMNENSLLYYKRSNTPPKTVLKTCFFFFFMVTMPRGHYSHILYYFYKLGYLFWKLCFKELVLFEINGDKKMGREGRRH